MRSQLAKIEGLVCAVVRICGGKLCNADTGYVLVISGVPSAIGVRVDGCYSRMRGVGGCCGLLRCGAAVWSAEYTRLHCAIRFDRCSSFEPRLLKRRHVSLYEA